MSDIKMKEVFNLPMRANGYAIIDCTEDNETDFPTLSVSEHFFEPLMISKAAAQAINSHDKLKEQNEKMYEMLKSLTEMSSEDAKLYIENASDIVDLLKQVSGE